VQAREDPIKNQTRHIEMVKSLDPMDVGGDGGVGEFERRLC